MSRWAMVADLRRCVGCQTCTAACKDANATPPPVQYRRVIDIESGKFPNVSRTFVPVGCQHCSEPPCLDVCPSTATGKREDGIVTIDYDLCIGCSYCAVACPYQARYKVDKPVFSYGEKQTCSEQACEKPERLGVAQKCTFCVDRIDYGLENGLTPGVDPLATPACVNSCISGALQFGDIDDPDSNVSQLVRDNKHFRMHESLGTGPGFYYLWEAGDGESELIAFDTREINRQNSEPQGAAVGGPESWLQQHWDWRAACNFIAGGTGTGLLLAAALMKADILIYGLLALAFVAFGLSMVWAEIGRPWRAMNVLFNPNTSWMTREAYVAAVLFATGVAAVGMGWPVLIYAASAAGLLFLYCQARILKAAKGIPVWREATLVPLVLVTGLAEGAGILYALSHFLNWLGFAGNLLPTALPLLLAVLILLRLWRWKSYLGALSKAAPRRAIEVLGRLDKTLVLLSHMVPLILIACGILLFDQAAGMNSVVAVLSGGLVLLGGWVMKYSIITRASYNQGYALDHTPERGTGTGGGCGAQPGWECE